MSIELYLARRPFDPSKFFIEQAEICEELGISQQDVYGDFAHEQSSSWLKRFEKVVADHLGKDDAIFLPSGVMAQNIVLMAASGAKNPLDESAKPPRRKFIVDHSSHLLLHEKDAHTMLLGLTPIVAPADDSAMVQKPMMYDDIASLLDDVDNVCALIVETPHREIGGKCTPWEDLVKMSEHCRRNGIIFHMDGARLWEASAAYEQPLSVVCALFDSVFVSFYKGLGAISGSMLLSTKPAVDEFRVWLRRFGGNIFSQMPTAVSCWHGFIHNKDAFPARKKRLQEVIAAISIDLNIDTAAMSAVSKDDKWVVRFDPPVPEVSLIHVYFNAGTAEVTEALEAGAKSSGVKCCAFVKPARHGAEGQSYCEFNMVKNNKCAARSCGVLEA